MGPTAAYAQVATTIAQLKAITAANRSPNFCLLLPEIGSWVYYSPASTATADDVSVFMPSDSVGRWIVTNQLPSHTSLAIRGLGATPAIRLSSIEGRGVITPGTQGLTIGGSANTLGFYGVNPVANATINSPGQNTTDMHRCLSEIRTRLQSVGLITGGTIGAATFEKIYNVSNPTDDLIGLLGTVNSVFTNPHPSKTTNSASSIGLGTVVMFTDRTDNDFYPSDIANSWVQIDIATNDTSRRVTLTGLGLKSRNNAAVHLPINLTIEGSNDGAVFTTIFTWASIGFTAASQWRAATFSNSTGYRYIRVRQPGVNSTGGNFLTLSELALYGSLNVL